MSDAAAPSPSISQSSATTGSVAQNVDKKKDKFRFGNYNRYYGVRNKGFDHDPRVDAFPPDWFRGKRVLDIGCNAGHLTLEVASRLEPAHILGIDIDDHLVGVARKNIRHYCAQQGGTLIGKFPASLVETEAAPEETEEEKQKAVTSYNKFPKNVWFLRENYVLESDEYLDMVREEHELILALSITKWIHMNWGDAGLKRFFRRTFLHLRPGGMLLVEAQEWSSYYKKAKMTKDLFETYKAIQFKPHQFREFLVSEVGYTECETLQPSNASSKGFERAIMAFRKPVERKKPNNGAPKKPAGPQKQKADEAEGPTAPAE